MFRFIIKQQQQPFKKIRLMSTLATAKQVNAGQLQQWVNSAKTKPIHNDFTIIDVRERNEVEKFGKIKGAINVPYKSLSSDMFIAGLSDLNKHSKVSLCHFLLFSLGTQEHELTGKNRLYFNACLVVVVMKQLF